MRVKITYQPFEENMAIFIDDQPLGQISALTKYQSMSFLEWCGSLLSAIAEEVNDNFDLIYSGRETEYKLLKQMLVQCRSCTSLQYEKPSIADSALIRLKKLSRLVMNGVDCPKFTVPLHIYTDIPEEDVRELLKKILPKLSFCTVTIVCHATDEMKGNTDKKASIALLSDRYDLTSVQTFSGKTAGIVGVGKNICCCMQGTVLMMAASDGIQEILADLLELVYYPLLLREALSKVDVLDNSPFYSDVFVLDKTEPQIFVKLPKSIEFGQTVAVQTTTIPKTRKQADIRVKTSNDTVLAYTDEGLKAVGTGEAVVEIFEMGKTVPLMTTTITAYRTNRIQKLTIYPEQVQMCVGDVCNIKNTFLPSDADNTSKISLISEDGTTVGIQSNDIIIGRRPGRCAIFYEAQSVKSPRCSVSVFPRLESLSVKMESTFIRQNEFSRVEIVRNPVDATLDNLSVRIEPAELGTFDKGNSSFFAREAGKGSLVVCSDRNDVKTIIPIEVVGKSDFSVKKLLKGIGIALLIIIAWCILQQFM